MSIIQFSQNLLAHLGIEGAEIQLDEQEKFVLLQINVSEEDSGLLIGYHGDVLGSLQRILQLAYHETYGDKRVVVNINDYKQRREAQLKEMTMRVAERVLESGQPYVFPFLPSNERLVVHQTITETPEFAGLESVSMGEGAARRLHLRKKGVATLAA
jgi:spoIIIJ-associated protein